MDFEFDPNKNDSNLERHGIDFIDAQELWDVDHVIVPMGDWGHRIRLISCHRADARWEKI